MIKDEEKVIVGVCWLGSLLGTIFCFSVGLSGDILADPGKLVLIFIFLVISFMALIVSTAALIASWKQ